METSANRNEGLARERAPANTGWVVVIGLPGGLEGRSSPLASEQRAMVLAFDLADKGDEVLRIEGPAETVTGERIAEARAQKRGEKPCR